ncbi:MAG: ATP-binding protein [Ilumatobacter sp.]
MNSSSTQLEVTLPSETSALGSLRLQLAMDAADSGADLDVVEELVLVASELASNVIRHTDEEQVRVRLGKSDDEWTLDVSGAGSLDAIPGRDGMPSPMQEGGRGLVIVRAMMDAVELLDDDGDRWIRARKWRS